ncbi:glycosyltransferase family 4 protein [Cupriavidus basilensis]|uniref:Glycosyltransferase family 4 protein n=1 Tax=Cupriavidus basilensis TaxID=68895 RepID=A0A7M2H980_9BURK|nr:glycosyltransferase family 4 protein [Cupriavidus basilensis]QOT80682.1 glycosyltransferase family 4 protein [Cupriavidus basilensis]
MVNTIFPDASSRLGLPAPVYGGWMYALAGDLAAISGIELAVATVYEGERSQYFDINGIRYYLIPRCKRFRRASSSVLNWRQVALDFQPDLAHVHGTECSHGMEMMEACPTLKYLVSIQGLVSVYHRYYMAGMSNWEVFRNITLRDILRWDTLFHARRSFQRRGIVEREYINRAIAVIGRTEWDYSHIKAIRPDATYHFCNESLRDEFYSAEKWSVDRCVPHSIFLSQASYPIKGLHEVLKAVALLKRDFPDIKVKIAGNDITKSSSLADRLKRSGYGKYVRNLIVQLGLTPHVEFLGSKSAAAMRAEYMKSHVFISPSSIENSPNSIGEAQILGVPVLASFVGGVPTMLQEFAKNSLYRFGEYEVLAVKIREIFKHTGATAQMAGEGMAYASQRHDRQKNLNKMLSIYRECAAVKAG